MENVMGIMFSILINVLTILVPAVILTAVIAGVERIISMKREE